MHGSLQAEQAAKEAAEGLAPVQENEEEAAAATEEPAADDNEAAAESTEPAAAEPAAEDGEEKEADPAAGEEAAPAAEATEVGGILGPVDSVAHTMLTRSAVSLTVCCFPLFNPALYRQTYIYCIYACFSL